MYKNCIVVPVIKHLHFLTEDEKLSLEQLYRVLGKYLIYLIGPDTVNWDEYRGHAKKFNTIVTVKIFRSGFGSIQEYNELLLSKQFYCSFSNIQYMLIYQTDAFVFNDEFIHWCNMKYDYIGSPWFNGWGKAERTSKIIGVGNGGFSLRNIKTCKRVINKMSVLKKLWKFYQLSFIKKYLSFSSFLTPIKPVYRINNNIETYGFLFSADTRHNEDLFFGMYFPSIFNNYKLAPVKEAIKFGFEVNAPILFEMNNYKLPFGCHAWKKYDWDFWKKYIKER